MEAATGVSFEFPAFVGFVVVVCSILWLARGRFAAQIRYVEPVFGSLPGFIQFGVVWLLAAFVPSSLGWICCGPLLAIWMVMRLRAVILDPLLIAADFGVAIRFFCECVDFLLGLSGLNAATALVLTLSLCAKLALTFLVLLWIRRELSDFDSRTIDHGRPLLLVAAGSVAWFAVHWFVPSSSLLWWAIGAAAALAVVLTAMSMLAEAANDMHRHDAWPLPVPMHTRVHAAPLWWFGMSRLLPDGPAGWAIGFALTVACVVAVEAIVGRWHARTVQEAALSGRPVKRGVMPAWPLRTQLLASGTLCTIFAASAAVDLPGLVRGFLASHPYLSFAAAYLALCTALATTPPWIRGSSAASPSASAATASSAAALPARLLGPAQAESGRNWRLLSNPRPRLLLALLLLLLLLPRR
jgi:hypothetical protein